MHSVVDLKVMKKLNNINLLVEGTSIEQKQDPIVGN